MKTITPIINKMICRYVFVIISAIVPMCVSAQSSEQIIDAAVLKINSGNSLYDQGRFKSSLEEFEKAYDLLGSINEQDYSVYCLVHMHHCYTMLGNVEKAACLEDQLVSIYVAVMKQERPLDTDVMLVLSNEIANILVHHNRIDDAIILRKNILEVGKKMYGESAPELLSNLCSLANLYISAIDFVKAQTVTDEAMAIVKNDIVDADTWVEIIMIQCQIWANTGEIGLAIDMFECENLKGLTNVSPAIKSLFYSNYADLLTRLGQFEKALAIDLEQLPFVIYIYGKASIEYGISIMNISEMYAVMDDYVKAEAYIRKALDVFDSIGSTAATYRYRAYCKLASTIANNDPSEAAKMRLHCVETARDLFGEHSVEYADALIYSVPMNSISEEDISTMEKALSIKRNLDLDNTNDYIAHLGWLAMKYRLRGEWEKAAATNNTVLAKTMAYVWSNFTGLQENQRESLWKRVRPNVELSRTDICEYVQSTSEWNFDLIGRLAAQTYNGLLLEKGLLMESTTQLNALIKSSDDPEIIQLSEEQQMLTQQRDKCQGHADNYAQLTKQIDACKRQILSLMMKASNFADFVWTTCSDIQKVLKEGEVAIEFFSYPIQETTGYGAVWIKPGSAPMGMSLFLGSELDTFEDDGQWDIDNPLLYKTVWAALSTFTDIKSASTIYFAPVGQLYTLPIENLVDSNGVRASEKWELVRLSSTRELTKIHKKRHPQEVALFGGLNYGMDANDLITQSRATSVERSGNRATELRGFRYGVDELPYTKDEIVEIAGMLQQNGKKPTTYCESKGTEEAFRALSGQKVDIIHLATHGFFWSPETAERRNYVGFLANPHANKTTVEDYSMLRSGLLFSGANVSLSGQKLPADVEDGVLTAQELSSLDLENLDLVVMSACDTGLGDVSGEGVFGLQRGFKLAGAKSLLMSLWKVDDEATKVLMTEFYRNLLGGKSKTESLRLAQTVVKSQEDWINPKYWAGFILLDALD